MIRGDSSDYELLKKWCEKTPVHNPKDRFYSLEIGVREGLGSKIIMDVFKERLKGRPYMHFGIDPYGNLNYQHYDDSGAYTCDYTDDMYEQMVKDFEEYPMFNMIKMTDTQFMNENGHLEYFNFVHFDGPHMTKDVITESVWFANRSVKGTRFVFDDFPKYDMELIHKVLEKYGFSIIELGKNKICLERTQ
jgi:hypothetical protein